MCIRDRFFPAPSFSEKLQQIIPWLVPMALFALVAGFLLSFGLSRRVANGFRIMQSNIQLVEKCAYNDVVLIPAPDEFGRLSVTFAHMASHIDGLIRENREREQSMHALEIDVLRAQISPHFLSNALNCVRSLAAMQGMDHIERLTAAIIRLLRAALGSRDMLVPLREEIEYVRNYVEICQYQYLNDFSLTVEADPTLLDALMPSMLLQPLVENAVIHGIADTCVNGAICIRAQRSGGDLLLCVTDNGQGMSAGQIRALLSQTSNTDKRRFSGIGLTNVRRRIQMRFGDQYDLQIFSEPGKYTTVQLSVPYLTQEESK